MEAEGKIFRSAELDSAFSAAIAKGGHSLVEAATTMLPEELCRIVTREGVVSTRSKLRVLLETLEAGALFDLHTVCQQHEERGIFTADGVAAGSVTGLPHDTLLSRELQLQSLLTLQLGAMRALHGRDACGQTDPMPEVVLRRAERLLGRLQLRQTFNLRPATSPTRAQEDDEGELQGHDAATSQQHHPFDTSFEAFVRDGLMARFARDFPRTVVRLLRALELEVPAELQAVDKDGSSATSPRRLTVGGLTETGTVILSPKRPAARFRGVRSERVAAVGFRSVYAEGKRGLLALAAAVADRAVEASKSCLSSIVAPPSSRAKTVQQGEGAGREKGGKRGEAVVEGATRAKRPLASVPLNAAGANVDILQLASSAKRLRPGRGQSRPHVRWTHHASSSTTAAVKPRDAPALARGGIVATNDAGKRRGGATGVNRGVSCVLASPPPRMLERKRSAALSGMGDAETGEGRKKVVASPEVKSRGRLVTATPSVPMMRVQAAAHACDDDWRQTDYVQDRHCL